MKQKEQKQAIQGFSPPVKSQKCIGYSILAIQPRYLLDLAKKK